MKNVLFALCAAPCAALVAPRLPAVPVAVRSRAHAASMAVPQRVRQLNDATKWIVVAAQTSAVLCRRDFASPFIVTGTRRAVTHSPQPSS